MIWIRQRKKEEKNLNKENIGKEKQKNNKNFEKISKILLKIVNVSIDCVMQDAQRLYQLFLVKIDQIDSIDKT